MISSLEIKIAVNKEVIIPINNVVVAGGCALNSVANGLVFEKTKFKNMHIHPAAGDDGLAVGAVKYISNSILKENNIRRNFSVYLGNYYSDGLIEKELKSLKDTFNKIIIPDNSLLELMEKLKKINLMLWDIEDGKRNAEKNKKFDERFIELARNVYKFNDERAKIKLKINNLLGSNIKEVKSYD